MRLSVPFAYTAAVRARGSRRGSKMIEQTFVERIDIEIVEASGSAAPVAASWTQYEAWDDERYTKQVREYDGRLYRAKVRRDVDCEESPLTAEWLNSIEMGVTPTYRSEATIRLSEFADGKAIPSPEDFAELVNDNRDAVMEKMTLRADQMLLIDGVVWETTPAPLIRLGIDTGGELVSARAFFSASECDDHEGTHEDDPYSLRIDFGQLEIYRTILEASGTDSVDEALEPAASHALHILSSNTFERDLARVALVFLDANGEDLRHMPPNRLIAWAQTKRAALTIARSDGDAQLDPLVGELLSEWEALIAFGECEYSPLPLLRSLWEDSSVSVEAVMRVPTLVRCRHPA